MTDHTNRFNLGIQYLRGLSALTVVLSHYGMALLYHNKLKELLNYGQLGVQVFFFISGYVIVLAMIKIGYRPIFFPKFILRRSIRIDIVYITAIIFTLLTFWLLNKLSLFDGSLIEFNIWQFLAHLFYYVPFTKYEFYNHIFWTLSIEFQFYVIIGLFYFISQAKLFRIIFLILFALTSFLKYDRSFYLLTTYAPFFAMGIATLHYNVSKEKIYLLLMMLFLGLICYNFGIVSGFLILISVLAILFIEGKIQPLFFLGKISYSLYIIHPLIFIISQGIIKRIFPTLFNFELVVLFINVAVAIIGSYIYYVLIERPSVILSKKIIVN